MQSGYNRRKIPVGAFPPDISAARTASRTLADIEVFFVTAKPQQKNITSILSTNLSRIYAIRLS